MNFKSGFYVFTEAVNIYNGKRNEFFSRLTDDTDEQF
jgi:hypothetical protein